MTILWCGGEDVDFPNGAAFPLYDSGSCDSNFSRCSQRGTGIYISNTFTAIPLTHIWVHALASIAIDVSYDTLFVGATNLSGLGVYAVSNSNDLMLKTYNGSAWTTIATFLNVVVGILLGTDLHIKDYGSSATVDIYRNGALIASYTGNISVPGLSGFTNVAFKGEGTYGGRGNVSEVIVADEDTRLMRLKTLAPSATGDTNSWSGSYADIDETTISDTDKLYTSTPDADALFNLTNMPSGNYTPLAVKLNTRFVNESSQHGLQQGVKTNGSIYLSDTQQALKYWGNEEVLYNTNPVTGLPWTSAEIEALQFAYRHKVIA